MKPNTLKIAKISGEEAKVLADGQVIAKLGSCAPLNSMALPFIADLLPGETNFVIEWEGDDGSRALRGVALGNQVIGSVEDTHARSIDGCAIGIAEYLMRYGGESGCHQKVLIVLF